MKKIKKLFLSIAAKVALGDSFIRLAFLAIVLTLSSTASAQIFCGTARSSTSHSGSYTLNLTCKNVSGTTYQMILDFPTTVTNASNINIGANPGPVNVGASPVWTNSNKTLTFQFTAASTPTLYVGILFVIISGVEVRWDFPLGSGINFATTCAPVAPSLTTTAATAIAGTSATINGNISSNGNSSITSYGFYWSTTNGFANGTGTQVELGTTNFTGNISNNLTGLAYSTPYYYKAYATNAIGTTYGTQQTFTTTSEFPPPTLGSPTATTITNNSATLGASVLTVGSPVYTVRGTSYKTTTGVVATDNQQSDGTNTGATGAYSHSRSGLSPQQQYFYVGYATNTSGTGISSEGSFRTLSNPPTAQPTTFTTTAGVLSLVANWNAASFPASGATRAGYILIYSTGTPTLSSVNGTAPTAGVGTLVNVGNTILPAAPALTTTLSSLTAGALYNLLIVPYTWDGSNNSTYNYLTSGAITTTGTPLDIPAAPTPPARTASNVVSVYSDAYTVGVSNPAYGSSSAVTPGGNAARLYTSSNNGVLSFTNTTAVASGAMTTLHMDIYSTTSQAAQMLIQINGVNSSNRLTPNGVWTSLDIPSTAWAAGFGASLSSIGILPYAGAGTFYVDNVYFYKGGPPTITNFPAITKVMGDAPFTLGTPTSNSAGAWTYSITTGNGTVANISGNTVTLVAPGTAVVRATQAANGVYDQGFIEATLTVTASTTPLAGPTAPPVRNYWDAYSVFSGETSYTVVPGTRNYNPGWGQAGSASVINVAGDDLWRAINLNYQGIVFGSNVDVSAMTHFHVDVWTFNETSLQFFQISNTTGERSYSLTPLVQGQWNSYDIPMTAWTSQSGFTATALKEFKIVGTGGKTVYLDNMYFYRAATELPPTLGAFTVPAKVLGDVPFELTPPTSNSSGAWTYSVPGGSTVASISGNMVTVLGTGSVVITATQAAVPGVYGATSTTATLVVTPPAAPNPPTRNSWDVISYYSDTNAGSVYTVASSPTWGGSQNANVTLSGNTARLFNTDGNNAFTNAQLAFTAKDVSQMTHLHIDVYSVNQTPLQFKLNNTGTTVTLPTPVNGWTAIDIPLSNFGVALNAINNIRIDHTAGAQTPLRIAYFDNIYFYRDATDAPPTIGTLTVPSPKVLGDAPFTLTNPTSDSSGAWTYSASPAGVVTFSGNTVTIVGGGTTTITATQAAVPGVFGPGSASASLVVLPSASPIPPARDPSSVISMYTGTPAVYTNAPNYNFGRAFWTAGATLTEVPNGTNTALRVDNLGYIGLIDIGDPAPANRERRLNVSTMNNLHLDIYVNQPFANLFFWLLTNGDQRRDITNLVAGWNSIDIPLSEFTGANLASVYGLKFEQNQPGTLQMYIDNVYFSKACYTPTATIVSNGGDFCPGSNATFTVNGTEGSTLDYTVTGQIGTQQLALTGVDQTITVVNPSGDVTLDLLTVTNALCLTTTSSSTFETGSATVSLTSEIDFNSIDDDCDGSLYNGHAPVVVDIITPSGALATMTTSIDSDNATNTGDYSGVDVSYKFKVTKTNAPTSVAYVTSSSPNFDLTLASNVAHSSTYDVQATAIVNGEEQPYNGNTRTFTTPAAPIISNPPTQTGPVGAPACAYTLATINSY
ncbi:hypothetical protein L1S35_13115, partial [Flavobacterium sp. AS60]|uniref:beta strand repeat-containing protein n=1 Tax=Flavobacterium anseongense TaxID=2910677 RepID=UPI00351D325B|nr:hypothetical protein [Flavobacterium sp. AS60]